MISAVNKSDKRGLIRGFIVIVFGILFLSFLGFDLRTELQEFEQENSEEIGDVKQWLFQNVTPSAEAIYHEAKIIAEDNNISIETATEVVQYLIQNAGKVDIPAPNLEVTSTSTDES